MSKSNHTQTLIALIGGAMIGCAATLAVVFLIPVFNSDGATDWRADIPSTNFDGRSAMTDAIISVENLDDILLFDTDFERKAALFGLMDEANETSLIKFFDESQNLDSEHLRNMSEGIIIQKLASLNPMSALEQVIVLPLNRQEDLISAIFEEISLSDINEARSLALDLKPSLQQAALIGILQARHKHSNELLLEVATQLDQTAFAVKFLAEAVAFSPYDDPASAWNQIVFDREPNLAQTEFLIRVASEWLVQDGISVVDQISASLKDEIVRDAVIRAVLHRFAQEDPRAAMIEAAKLTGNSRELALRTIAEVWARFDPEGALAGIATLESGKSLNLLQEAVLQAWATNDPLELLDMLAIVPERLRAMAREEAMMAFARISPGEAKSFLSDLEDDDLRIKLAKEIATHWSEQDPHAALDWVLNEQFTTDVQQAETLMIVLAGLATKDPDLAFRTARDQPIVLRGQYYRGMEVTVIQQLVETNIDKALAMLSEIRSTGLTTTHAYSEVGRAMIRDGQFDRALALGQRLGERSRRNYNGSLMYQWAMTDPETLFDKLETLPSEQLKDQAARGLVRYNDETKALNSEQMERVASYLPEGYVDPYNRVRRMDGEMRDWFDQQVQVIFVDTIRQEEVKEE